MYKNYCFEDPLVTLTSSSVNWPRLPVDKKAYLRYQVPVCRIETAR